MTALSRDGSIVVQKFGGSVLSGVEAFAHVVPRIARTLSTGRSVVAVVSAFEGVTDSLLDRARSLAPAADPAALDLLAATGELQSTALLSLALAARGIATCALSPWQIGIHTDARHRDARIMRVDPRPIRARLRECRAVVVPGFVGRVEGGDRITTLGRGGSDLTAVVLAAALEAEACELYKDVPGYFSADPALVPSAVHRPELVPEEALELSRSGSDLLQERAVEWAAQRLKRELVVRSLVESDPRATTITRSPGPGRQAVIALAHRDRLVSLVGAGLGGDPRIAAEAREVLAAASIRGEPVSSSSCRLTLAVPVSEARRALIALHDRFALEEREPALAAAAR